MFDVNVLDKWAVVSDGGEVLQRDPHYRVFPERRLPGRLKQTGVCERLLGKVVSFMISFCTHSLLLSLLFNLFSLYSVVLL